jgi:L-asparagine transporter-like permease
MILLHMNTDGLGIVILILHLVIIGLSIALITVHRKLRSKAKKSIKAGWVNILGISSLWIVFILFLLLICILIAYLTDSHPLLILLFYAIVYAILIILYRIRHRKENDLSQKTLQNGDK